jgi:hypothetical protein
MGRLLCRAAASAAAIVLATADARAEPGLTPLDTAVPDSVIEERLRFLEDRLDGSKTHGQIWYWSWMTVNGGSAVILGTLAGLADKTDNKVNNGVQAGLGAIGVADLLLRPLEARFGADPIRDQPEGTRAEKIAKLRAAEDQLERNAERAEERTSYVQHGANLALNGAAGLIIGLVGKPSDGLIAGLSGAAGGAINILTQPWAPESDWEDYQRLVAREGAGVDVHVQLVPLRDGAGVSLTLTW